MRKLKVGLLVAITLGLVACDKIASYSLNGEEAKYSYAIGYQFAKNMKDQDVTVDASALALAIKDVMGDKPTRLTEEEMQTAMKAMYEKRKEKESHAATENKKKGDEFLSANKTKEGVKTTESGLQYKIDEEGDAKAESPKPDSLVTVHYKGTLIDGKEFDSSYSRGQPANFPLGGVIPGWQEALKMMKKGAKWKIYVPPELAYGDRARPGIPANSVLVFDVNLLDIQAAAETNKSTEKELKTKQKASAKK
jgi:FKBP-type peptidyl-prolyl cis-trans isomerase FkpA/FKBP-type peptidyl-prolyl cis-trans isomerase FklB